MVQLEYKTLLLLKKMFPEIPIQYIDHIKYDSTGKGHYMGMEAYYYGEPVPVCASHGYTYTGVRAIMQNKERMGFDVDDDTWVKYQRRCGIINGSCERELYNEWQRIIEDDFTHLNFEPNGMNCFTYDETKKRNN